MKTTACNTLKALIAATTMAAAAIGAHAADAPQVHVKYADLDVNSAAGAAALNRRIKAAAERVCAFAGDRDLARRIQFDACAARAIADATAAVRAKNTQLASLK